MKLISIIGVFAIFLFCSCEKLLVEKPKSLAVETFYNTTAEVDVAIGAIYSPLRAGGTVNFSATYQAILESSTDFFLGRASYAPLNEFQGLDGTGITRVGTIWNNFYLSIRNANIVIERVPNASALTDAQKSSYIAEARFLRALTYFHLVRNWGGVILRTETNMMEQDLPRSSTAEIYKLITDDLVFAESNLPDKASVPGRATKWAAKTALAEAYLTQGLNQDAADKAKEVMLSGNYSLIPVSDPNDFQKIFGPEVVTSPEEIFSLKYSLEQQWDFPLYTHGVGTPYVALAGYMAIYSLTNNTMYSNWDDDDLRKEYNWYPWEFGLGGNTILNKKFQDPSPQRRNDYPLYRYADVLLLFAEASCRAAGQPTSEGVAALNSIHRRAYGYPALEPSPVDFQIADYDEHSFIDLTRREHGYETVAEGKRWLYLKRMDDVKAYIKATTGKDIADKHFLWPIPASEFNYNSALDPAADQNPGY
ncbi:MAG TPA: RagB/SusD family nutrient uptake outer membrane protein [Flavitalea sp.]|nr:RagB/SusD family nutrient uptake outer membrane protein [Flavitalea sp.]